MTHFNKFFYVFFAFILAVGLTTDADAQNRSKKTKSKKAKSGKSSTANNMYQDLTTRYNGYFNAKILMQQSLLKLQEQHKDDFDGELLDVLAFNDSEKTSAVSGDMETILKKTSTAIQKHPNAKWVDDCYLLMGQAQFFKGDYEEAIKSFQFINNRFKRGIRKTDFQKRVKNKRDKEGIKFNIGGLSNEDGKVFDKEEREKKNEERKKEAEDLKKQREKEMADRKKEKEQQMKQREKDRKEMLKERAKIKKQKEVERKRKLKWKEKNRKRRIKGQRPLPYVPKYTFEKKETPSKEEEKEPEIEEEKEVEEEVKDKEEQKEEKAEEETTEETEEDGEFSNFILNQDQTNEDENAVKYNDRMMSFLFHQPAKYESVVWLARSYMAMGNTEDAITSLDYIRQDKNMPRKHRADLNGLYAQYHLDKGETDEAYDFLDLAIAESRKKPVKARFHYIQAQISEQDDDYKANVSSLKKVLKSRPGYDMAFNAKLDLAKNQIKSGDKSSKESIRFLEKMIKDDKNYDNQDQIYMAMADIAIDEGNVDTAFEYLKKATENSTINKDVKAKAYLKIAEMYYEQEKYLLSSAYYDSSLVILPKSYPNYEEIALRKDVLAELAGHINTVELQDSLLRLVAMPEAVRNDVIDDLIEQIEKQAQEEAEAASVADLSSNNDKNDKNNGGGTFYFYSENARSLGKIDFIREWGDRPNVDNWRRQEAIPSTSSSVADTDEQNLKDLALGGQLSRDMFLNALPFSKEAQQEAKNKIEASLYQIAVIYDEKLNADDKALTSYETLLKRYPRTQYDAQAHYALYQLYKAEKNTAKANTHKNWLAENAADSEFAKLLVDGGKEKKAEKAALLAYYEETYRLFEKGEYNEVITRKQNAEVQFASNSLQPEFDLLEAFVIGSTDEVNEYISALQNVAAKHKGTEVQTKADEILEYLDPKKRKNKEAASKYKLDENQQHYFLVVLDGYSQNITKAINNISNFNKANHASANLKVTQMLLDKEHPIILIKNFKNKAKSDLYRNSISKEIANAMKTVEVPYQAFSISKPNFNTYFKDKNTEAYMEFFQNNY